MRSLSMRTPMLRGVVWDLDGTLTVPNLDFAAMYDRSGLSRDEDILVAMRTMDPSRREAVAGIIEEIEEEGRRTMRLMHGARDVGQWLAGHGIRTALVTRNTRRTVEHLQRNLWRDLPAFEPAISRDDTFPPKPDPAALVAIAEAWDCRPEEMVMCGDSIENDVRFGASFGATTVLLDAERRDSPADAVISNLLELPGFLWQRFQIDSPLGTLVSTLKFAPPQPSHPACVAAAAGDISVALDGSLGACDESGQTPLHWAVEAGDVESVRALVAAGADVNARGYLGSTAVLRAARNGDCAVLEVILAAPSCSCVDAPNDKWQTPLHMAAFNRHRRAVQVLLEAGASTTVLDRKGRSAAEDTDSAEIQADILRHRGWNVAEQ